MTVWATRIQPARTPGDQRLSAASAVRAKRWRGRRGHCAPIRRGPRRWLRQQPEAVGAGGVARRRRGDDSRQLAASLQPASAAAVAARSAAQPIQCLSRRSLSRPLRLSSAHCGSAGCRLSACAAASLVRRDRVRGAARRHGVEAGRGPKSGGGLARGLKASSARARCARPPPRRRRRCFLTGRRWRARRRSESTTTTQCGHAGCQRHQPAQTPLAPPPGRRQGDVGGRARHRADQCLTARATRGMCDSQRERRGVESAINPGGQRFGVETRPATVLQRRPGAMAAGDPRLSGRADSRSSRGALRRRTIGPGFLAIAGGREQLPRSSAPGSSITLAKHSSISRAPRPSRRAAGVRSPRESPGASASGGATPLLRVRPGAGRSRRASSPVHSSSRAAADRAGPAGPGLRTRPLDERGEEPSIGVGRPLRSTGEPAASSSGSGSRRRWARM